MGGAKRRHVVALGVAVVACLATWNAGQWQSTSYHAYHGMYDQWNDYASQWFHSDRMTQASPAAVYDFVDPGSAWQPNGTDPLNDRESFDQFIVWFDCFKPVDDHRSALFNDLEKGLGGGEQLWVWVDRRNAAVAYPTDFALLRILRQDQQAVLPALSSLLYVKGIHIDKKMNRAPLQFRNPFPVGNEAGEYREEGAGDPFEIGKGPGRIHTPFSFEPADQRHLSFSSHTSLKDAYQASQLWSEGYTGSGIKVGLFDTGVIENHPDLRNVMMRTDWTYQNTTADGHGHGSFVAGCVASANKDCPSTAPDAELYTFKVFTDDSESFTSWYLDAVNFALYQNLDLINVSIGGPDYLDRPFVEKFRELVASGVVMFSAFGNDGPRIGTGNNPADEMFVIGVGSHDTNNKISRFQSRGMTIQESPIGYGRVKPDVSTFGDVNSLKINGGCKMLSGTSVSSPVAVGLAAALASSIPEAQRPRLLNPGSMKQVLVEGADRMDGESVYLQGGGMANLLKSFDILKEYVPRASALPPRLDLTDDIYMWPHSRSPLYADRMPLVLNLTIVNGMGSTGYFSDRPTWVPTNDLGKSLRFTFDYSDVLWPWSGALGIWVHVSDDAAKLSGVATGTIRFTVESPPFAGDTENQFSKVEVPFMANVIPTPPRSKRVLWDDYHNIQYPPHFLPADDVNDSSVTLDWTLDHPHTNFFEIFNELVSAGFYVEVLGSSLTCFNASSYGALVLADTEGEFLPEEAQKLEKDVVDAGLGLVILAEWYNEDHMSRIRFFDDNTRHYWPCTTGGGNVPSLNRLLSGLGVAFTNVVVVDDLNLTGRKGIRVGGGTSLGNFPNNSTVFRAKASGKPVLGLAEVGQGRIVAFGDTGCFDSNQLRLAYIPGFITDFVVYAAEKIPPLWVSSGEIVGDEKLASDAEIPSGEAGMEPEKLAYLRRPLQCHMNAPLAFAPDVASDGRAHRDVSDFLSNSSVSEKPNVLDKKEEEATPHQVKEEEATPHQVKDDGLSIEGVPMGGTGGSVFFYFEKQVSVFILAMVVFGVYIAWGRRRTARSRGFSRFRNANNAQAIQLV